MAKIPNINPGGQSIPSGYVLGRVSPGTGQQELIPIGDLGRVMATQGIIPPFGSPASVTLTQPAAGLTITGGPSAFTFALANDLAALEGLGSTGIAVRTTTDTWAQRTITGTADKITLTDGNGVSSNPTITIAATYAGQTSIVTLGTVTTGAWNATVIAGQYGGTGVANTGKTITLGGNLTTAGAFDTTITVSGTTNSTLPAGTHTLAGLDVTQTWSADQTNSSKWAATESSSSTGINGAGGKFRSQNTDATANNYVRLLQAVDSTGGSVGQVLYQVLDHTNHEADFVVSTRSNGGANPLEALRVTGTTKAITTGIWNATKVGLAYGGTNADLSATGGASQVLQQASAGAAITVGQLSAAALSNGTTGTAGTAVVLATSPTLVTPVLGTATGTKVTLSGAQAFVAGADSLVGGVQGALSITHVNGYTQSRYSANTTGPSFRIGKSRGSIATAGAVAANDRLLDILAYGDDGSTNGDIPIGSAVIRAQVIGTVSTGVVPAFVSIQTMNAAGTLGERVRFGAEGGFAVGSTTDPGSGAIMAATTIRPGGYTVATLPAAGTAGRRAYVTDSLAPAYLVAIAGGGAAYSPVQDTGAAWVSA